MADKIVTLQDENNNNLFPTTSYNAVKDANGNVLPSDFTNMSGDATIVQVDGTSITSSGVANLQTINSDYNATTNKLATASDIPSVPTSDSDLTNDRYVRYDTASQGLNSTQKSNARTNIGAGTSNFDGAYSSLTGKPTLGTAAALNTGTNQGDIPLLGTNGKLPTSVMPASAITDTFVVASENAMLALSTAEVGDVAVRTDINKSFILKATPYSTLSNWQELLTPTDAVTSVNSQTGAVVLTASDVGAQSTLSASNKLNVDYTSDGTTNKVYTATEQSKLSGIESGAEVNDVTDVQINGTSILSSKVANLITNTAYNASSNKLATMSDLPTDYIKNSSSTTQTISVTGSMGDNYDTPLMLKSNISSVCWLGFKNSNDTIFGYLGAYSTSGDTHRLKFYDTATHILAYTSDIPDISGKVSLSSSDQQKIQASNTDTPIAIKGNSTETFIGFRDSNDTALGYIGVDANKKPVFYDTQNRELAFKSDIPSAITEISTQYTRITDLSTGVYRLTYNGTKYIYYSGTTLTSTHTVTGGAGAVILTVNRYSTTYWHWYYINGSTGYETIYFGYTSSSTGATSSKPLNSLLTNISSYVKNNLDYSTSSTSYALSAYQGYLLNQNKQDKLPTTTTAGQVLKSTSTAGTVEWGTVTPTLPSDVAYFVEESGTPSGSLPYYTKNEVDTLVATPHNHTIRSIAVTYESSSSTSANWSISVSLNAGEYVSGFMWVPSGDGSYENNRMWKPDGAPTFSTSSIVSTSTVVTITVPIARGASGGTCSIKGVVFVTKVG